MWFASHRGARGPGFDVIHAKKCGGKYNFAPILVLLMALAKYNADSNLGPSKLDLAWDPSLFLLPRHEPPQRFEKQQRPRLLARNFRRFRESIEISKWSRSAKSRADSISSISLRRRTLRRLFVAGFRVIEARRSLSGADDFSKRARLKAGWRTLRDNPSERKVFLSSYQRST